jgi:hypothetical protein
MVRRAGFRGSDEVMVCVGICRHRDVEDWFVLIINCRDDQMSTSLSEDGILTDSRNTRFQVIQHHMSPDIKCSL